MEEFKDIKQLYNRLIPALNAKVIDLKRKGIDYIKKEDIWNYLKVTKWKDASNLLLHQMVDDILNLDSVLLEDYVRNNLKRRVIKPILESEDDYER